MTKKHETPELYIWVLLCAVIGLLVILILLTLYPKAFFGNRIATSTVPVASLDEQSNTFLHDEEVVIVETASTTASTTDTEILPINRVLFEYVEVVDGCGAHFEGECLNVRSGPGTDYPSLAKLRNGMVLKVGGKVERQFDTFSTTTNATSTLTETWYKIVFDEWLRYPERVAGDWYVSADYVSILYDEGDKTIWEDGEATTTDKSIIVDRSEQKLYAYEGEELFMELKISTGLELTPTPRGTFTIFKKTPSRYMQGPLPNLVDKQRYDLPGVPWNMYFTNGGAVIHGAYWHNSFGLKYSHGCVNLPPDKAHELYKWTPLGTTVTVKN